MKKLMLTVLTVLSCGAAYALPVGDPTEASLFTNGLCSGESTCCDPCMSWCDMFSVRLGFYGDYVFNRHLEVKSLSDVKHDIDDTEIFTNAGWFVLNFCNRYELFATFGATDISIFTDGYALADPDNPASSTMVQLDFATNFSWSIGARAVAWRCGNFDLGVEGQYFRTRPTVDSLIRYASGDITYFNSNNRATWSEWQAGFVASYTICSGCPGVAFVPYMGVKVAGGTLDMGNLTFLFQGTSTEGYTLKDLKPKQLWGYAVGMTATVCNAVGVTVEGRFADEKALSVVGQFRF